MFRQDLESPRGRILMLDVLYGLTREEIELVEEGTQ